MMQKIRTYALPIAMLLGVVAHDIADSIGFLTPYLLFLMLLVSYSKLDFRAMRLSPMYGWMLAGQIVLAWVVYGLVCLWDPVVAEGAFICLFCPTATSAPVVAAMLGGNLSLLVGYSLLCNIVVALLSPLFFSFIGVNTELVFVDSCLIIFLFSNLLINFFRLHFGIFYSLAMIQTKISGFHISNRHCNQIIWHSFKAKQFKSKHQRCKRTVSHRTKQCDHTTSCTKRW